MFSKIFFSERLRLIRNTKNISAVELARAINVSKQAISLLESGKNYPHVNTLIALADYFNVSIDYLTGRTDNPDINK